MKLRDEIKILQLDGLMSREKQSKFLGIKKQKINDFWRRHPTRPYGFINGLEKSEAILIAPDCPSLYTDFKSGIDLCLWVDINALCIDYSLKETLKTMAKFQCWLHESTEENVRDKICHLVTSGYLQK